MPSNELDIVDSLIQKGAITEDEIPNHLKVPFRQRQNVKEGGIIQSLLDKGAITPDELSDPEKAKLQDFHFSNQTILEKATQAVGERVPAAIHDGAVNLGELTDVSESPVTQAIAKAIPQGAINALGEMQPAFATQANTFLGSFGQPYRVPEIERPEPKTRGQKVARGAEHFIYSALGFLPAFLLARGYAAPGVDALFEGTKVTPIARELVKDAIANTLQQGFEQSSLNASGVTDRNIFQTLRDIGQSDLDMMAFVGGLGVAGKGLSLASTGVAKALKGLFEAPEIPIALRDVVFSGKTGQSPAVESIERVKNGLLGTPDEILTRDEQLLKGRFVSEIARIADEHPVEHQGVEGIKATLEQTLPKNVQVPEGVTPLPPGTTKKDLVEYGIALNQTLNSLKEQIKATTSKETAATLAQQAKVVTDELNKTRSQYRHYFGGEEQRTPINKRNVELLSEAILSKPPASRAATRTVKETPKATQGKGQAKKVVPEPPTKSREAELAELDKQLSKNAKEAHDLSKEFDDETISPKREEEIKLRLREIDKEDKPLRARQDELANPPKQGELIGANEVPPSTFGDKRRAAYKRSLESKIGNHQNLAEDIRTGLATKRKGFRTPQERLEAEQDLKDVEATTKKLFTRLEKLEAKPPKQGEIIGANEIPPADYVETGKPRKATKPSKKVAKEAATTTATPEQLIQYSKILRQKLKETEDPASRKTILQEMKKTAMQMQKAVKTTPKVQPPKERVAPDMPKPEVNTDEAATHVVETVQKRGKKAKKVYTVTRDSVAAINQKIAEQRGAIEAQRQARPEPTSETVEMPKVEEYERPLRASKEDLKVIAESEANREATAKISEDVGFKIGASRKKTTIDPEKLEQRKAEIEQQKLTGQRKKGRTTDITKKDYTEDKAWADLHNTAPLKRLRKYAYKELGKDYKPTQDPATLKKIKNEIGGKISKRFKKVAAPLIESERGTPAELRRRIDVARHYAEKSRLLEDDQREILLEYARQKEIELRQMQGLAKAKTVEAQPTTASAIKEVARTKAAAKGKTSTERLSKVQQAVLEAEKDIAKTRGTGADIEKDVFDAVNAVGSVSTKPIEAISDAHLTRRGKQMAVILHDNAGKEGLPGFLKMYSDAAVKADGVAEIYKKEGDSFDIDSFLELSLKEAGKKHKLNLAGLDTLETLEAKKGGKTKMEQVKDMFDEANQDRPVSAKLGEALDEQLTIQRNRAEQKMFEDDLGSKPGKKKTGKKSHRGLSEEGQALHDKLDREAYELRERQNKKRGEQKKVGAIGNLYHTPPYQRDYTRLIPEEEMKSQNAEIEKALTADRDMRGTLRRAFSAAKDYLTKNTENYIWWEPTIRNERDILSDWRRFLSAGVDANLVARNAVYAILSPLREGISPRHVSQDYELFRRLLALKAAEEDLLKGRKTSFHVVEDGGDVSLQKVQEELARYESLANENIRQALYHHQQQVAAWWKTHVYERGIRPEPEPPNKWYFPHEVLDYMQSYKDVLPWIPKKATKPVRFYLKQRSGSVREINTNYVDVMTRLFSQMELDLQTETFARNISAKKAISEADFIEAYAHTHEIPREQAASLLYTKGMKGMADAGGLRMDEVLNHPDGRVFQMFRYDKNMKRRFGTQFEGETALDAVADSSPEVSTYLQNKGDFLVMLPQHITQRLEKLRDPEFHNDVFDIARNATTWWKSLTTGYAFIPFQMQNLLGDMTAAYWLQDPAAIRYIPRALRAMLTHEGIRETKTGRFLNWVLELPAGVNPDWGHGVPRAKIGQPLTQKQLGRLNTAKADLDKFFEERLIEAGVASEFQFASRDPRFNEFLKGHEPLTQKNIIGLTAGDLLSGNPWGVPHLLNEFREGTIRGSLLIHALEMVDRYKAGKTTRYEWKPWRWKGGIAKSELPPGRLADLHGFKIDDIPGEIARQAVIDYGAVPTKYARHIRGLLFPFATYYIRSTQNIARYIKANPADAALKIGVPYAAMQIYNNTQFPDMEDSLPPYQRLMPHVNGVDENGEPYTINFGFPWTTLVQMLGIDVAVDSALRGHDATRVASDWWETRLSTLGRTTLGLMNPALGGIVEMIQNKDWAGRPILTKKEETAGTKEKAKIYSWYMLNRILLPVSQTTRFLNTAPDDRNALDAYGLHALSFKAGMGMKDADLEAGQRANLRAEQNYQQMVYDQKFRRLLDAHRDAIVYRDPSLVKEEYQRQRNEPGVSISPADIKKAMQEPSYRLSVAQKKLLNTKTTFQSFFTREDDPAVLKARKEVDFWKKKAADLAMKRQGKKVLEYSRQQERKRQKERRGE